MRLFWQCLLSPRLYKVYREGPLEAMYQPQGLERYADNVIKMANTILNISIYASPFIIGYVYRRGFFTVEETKSLGRFFGGIGVLIAICIVVRAYGRINRPKYINFVNALYNPTPIRNAYLQELRKYDFEPEAWPSTFGEAKESYSTSAWKDMIQPFKKCANPHQPFYKRIPIQVLAFLATHTFGLRLIYPGCIKILQSLFWTSLFQGRAQLVEQYNGQRARITTEDGNIIDTMFVDNREKTPRGGILVVCCEGNSGYYEIGIMFTPIKAGYSAIGWNHPGFAGSTGLPYPSQEHLAIDAVMQYAMQSLDFKPEKIVLLGWSIGGYTAALAASEYPVRGLILDATFDDLLPLAQNQMPKSWALLVKEVVRTYVNLDIGDTLKMYYGAVQVIRRTEDEIITLKQGCLLSNRANELLLKIMDVRHPDSVLDREAEQEFDKLVMLTQQQRNNLDTSELGMDEKELMEVISKYMYDVKLTHCAPLPESDFLNIMERTERGHQEALLY